MNESLTEIVFLLDRSGSMAGLESDTIGGFNAFIEKQKKAEGKTVITTDGMENASQEFTYEKIKELIKYFKEIYSWEFIFLGANIDATKEAASIGISIDNAYKFEASTTGVKKMFDVANYSVLGKRDKK